MTRMRRIKTDQRQKNHVVFYPCSSVASVSSASHEPARKEKSPRAAATAHGDFRRPRETIAFLDDSRLRASIIKEEGARCQFGSPTDGTRMTRMRRIKTDQRQKKYLVFHPC